MEKKWLLTFTSRIIVLCLLIFNLESCKQSINPITDAPPPPPLIIFIYNQDDSTIFFNSVNDSISIIFPEPNSQKLIFAHLMSWPNISGPWIICDDLVTYSAINKIKTSLLFYNNELIPDTLFVDFKAVPYTKGWRGYKYEPIQISLNNRIGIKSEYPDSWNVYR